VQVVEALKPRWGGWSLGGQQDLHGFHGFEHGLHGFFFDALL